jgi:uracil-DNA glycosylase family 4
MPEGFFKELGISKLSLPKKKQDPVVFGSCEECGLYKDCKSPKMLPTGNGNKRILIVAEAPGGREDAKGVQLVGEPGQFLRRTLRSMGYDLKNDFWKTNAVRCYPVKSNGPTSMQVKMCRKYLMEAIDRYKPKGIIVFGETALEALIGHRLTGRIKQKSNKSKFRVWAGTSIPDQELKCWVLPMYHPAYLLHRDFDEALQNIWKKQLKAAIEKVKEPFPDNSYLIERVKYTLDEGEACSWINEMLHRGPKWVGFDYETTGIKPHRIGHRIHTASFAYADKAYSFPFFDTDRFLSAWKRFLASDIGKIVHNFSFEQLWSKVLLGVDIAGRRWDTMLGAHSVHNIRPTQLKFQTYTNLGILGYDDAIDPYITRLREGEDKKSSNAFNCIEDCPIEDTLQYGGVDSSVLPELFAIQRRTLGRKLRGGLSLFVKGAERLSFAQQRGFRIDVDEQVNVIKYINRRKDCIRKRIMQSDEVKQWDGPSLFEFGSNPQLSHLLYDILKFECHKFTGANKKSVDVEALTALDSPFTNEILDYRKWDKMVGTYISPYKREMVNGIIHPGFPLNTVTTYRGSSRNPNMQNVPKRDPRAKKIIRKIIVPRFGNSIVEWDYVAMEVGGLACYSLDPELIRYVVEEGDMHKERASMLFLRDFEDVPKTERQIAKNKHVFPCFYGSYYENTAPDLWAALADSTHAWLYECGIRDLGDFTDHVRSVEDKVWEQFHVTREWQQKTMYDYRKKGYIDLYTGFRCYGPMKRTEIINYRIQGSCFHILLWTFNQVSEEMDRLKMDKSFLLGQIHDAIVGDVHADDEEYTDQLIYEFGTKKVREHWDWIVVPLRIEKETSGVDGNWSQMNDAGILQYNSEELNV